MVFANILNALFKSRRESLGSTIESINGNAKYIELAKARTDQERCLKCGSHVVVPYTPAEKGGALNGVDKDELLLPICCSKSLLCHGLWCRHLCRLFSVITITCCII